MDSDGKRTSFSIRYGSGACGGSVSTDTVKFGEFSVTGQHVGETTEEPGTVFQTANFDGILGLAFKSIAVGGYPPVFETIVGQHGSSSDFLPQFAFYLGKDGADGELSLGSYNTERFEGELNWVPLSSATYWQFPFTSFKVGDGVEACPCGSCQAIADSGTSLIAGPTDQIQKINEKIGADYEGLVDCESLSTLPNVDITISGQKYSLAADDYILKVNQMGQEYCMSGFQSLEISGLWILGDVFMRKYYTVFHYGNGSTTGDDYAKVGFALAKHS